MPTIQCTTLPNGIRVITEECPDSQKTSICCKINVGSVHEPEHLNGISHFLEHMLFKGTTNKSALEINLAARKIGTILDAETDRTETQYKASVRTEHTNKLLYLLSDIIQNPLFNKELIEKERHVVLSEMIDDRDDVSSVIYDNLLKAAFPNQSISNPIDGNEQKLNSITRNNLIFFHRQHYTGSNLIISAAGNIKHEEFVNECHRRFKTMPKGTANSFPKLQYNGSACYTPSLTQISSLYLAFNGFSFKNLKDYYITEMLAYILKSHLYDEIREKKGLVYHVDASTISYETGGLFTIMADVLPQDLNKVLQEICRSTTSVAEWLSPENLAIAKETSKLSVLEAKEILMARAENNIFNEFHFGHPISTKDIFTQIDSITFQDVTEQIRQILKTKPSIAICSKQIQQCPSYEIVSQWIQQGITHLPEKITPHKTLWERMKQSLETQQKNNHLEKH